jgi:hypothetical protein
MLGLLMAFNQTQRAFRTSMTQVDVLESGRATASLLSREMEQIRPAYVTGTNLNLNFFAGLLTVGLPLRQPLPGPGNEQRLNVLDDVFFLTRENQTWTGIGYFVRIEDNARLRYPRENLGGGNFQLMGGRLYRFEKRLPVSFAGAPAQLFADFLTASANRAPLTNALMDGVVHFKVRAFDAGGNWLTNAPFRSDGKTNVFLTWSINTGEVATYEFRDDTVPASVEFELGLVEDRAWERYKSIPDAAARYQYLTNQAARVHVFRQRVAVRNVDPAAYQ